MTGIIKPIEAEFLTGKLINKIINLLVDEFF
jgi:hypothetical protein